MGKEKLGEHIEKILHKTSYVINESPKYHQILDDISDDDQLPTEVGGVSPVPTLESDVVESEEENIEEPEMDLPTEEPEMDMPDETIPTEEPSLTQEPEENVDVQQSIDKVQNEILKLNVETMKKVQSQVDILNNKVDELGGMVSHLDADVDEVKEPTDTEKLLGRKEDSHPFYMNLNDMWENNEFQARRDQYEEHGIKKLDDGSYIADFDSIKSQLDDEI